MANEPNLDKLENVRVRIAQTLFISFPVLLVVLLFSLYVLFTVIRGISEVSDHSKIVLSTAEKMALAASIQVAIGMVMGFVCVFIGLMMTWFGINAAFEFGGKVDNKAEISLKSASPGLLFFVGGIILISVSLYKPITYEEPGIIRRIPLNQPDRIKIDGKPVEPPPPLTKGEK